MKGFWWVVEASLWDGLGSDASRERERTKKSSCNTIFWQLHHLTWGSGSFNENPAWYIHEILERILKGILNDFTDWLDRGCGTSDAEAYHWSADGGHSWHQRTQQQQRIFDGAPRHRNRSRERWGSWRCGMVWGWMEWTRSFHLPFCFFLGMFGAHFLGNFHDLGFLAGASAARRQWLLSCDKGSCTVPQTLPRSEDLRNFPVTQVTVKVGPGSVDNDSSSSIMQS